MYLIYILNAFIAFLPKACILIEKYAIRTDIYAINSIAY